MHTARVARVQHRLSDTGLDALLVNHLPNVFYLSGFTGTAASLLITPAAQYFITDFRYHGRLGTEVQGPWELLDNSSRRLPPVLAEVSGPGRLSRLALEAEHLTLAQFQELDAAAQW